MRLALKIIIIKDILKYTYISVLVVLSASILLASCKTLQIEKPRESYLPASLEPALSEFPLQIEIDLKKMESAVNKSLKGLLYEGSQLNNQDMSVRIWKSSDFRFTVKNNVIEYKIPLKVWSRFGWKMKKFGLSVGDHYEANGNIALSYKTTISIDKNWKLVAKTTPNGYQWIETPRISVAGVNVPVTPIANIAMSQSSGLITKEIDKALADMVDLKKYAAMAWTMAQQPVQFSEENNLWIKIIPKDIFMTPFSTSGNKLRVGMSLSGLVESYMGVKPDTQKTIALPAFKLRASTPQQFNVNLAADATYEKISELARTQLVNKTFKDGKRSLTITGLNLYGSEGRAIVELDVIGSVKGRIYFSGNLQYNPEKMAVEIINPQFDLKTKNALLKSADWLLHGFILNKLSPYLTYPVKEDLENLKLESNKMLSGYSVYDGVSLVGTLNTITVEKVDLVPGAVRLSANVKGNVVLKIDELKF
ncbi:MAG: DUF4403 family protein [Paludibacteraceae bacterium]|nr:DUF4403 family protein [Paludibacteraceae bacterium]